VAENKNEYVAKTETIGSKADDIDIYVHGNMLTKQRREKQQ